MVSKLKNILLVFNSRLLESLKQCIEQLHNWWRSWWAILGSQMIAMRFCGVPKLYPSYFDLPGHGLLLVVSNTRIHLISSICLNTDKSLIPFGSGSSIHTVSLYLMHCKSQKDYKCGAGSYKYDQGFVLKIKRELMKYSSVLIRVLFES